MQNDAKSYSMIVCVLFKNVVFLRNMTILMRFFILSAISVLLLICGCIGHSIDPQLMLADNLMNSQPEKVYKFLKAIDPQSLSGSGNRAYYALLFTQAQYKNLDSIHSDSLIDIAVDYYRGSIDREKYTRALMYKGAALSDMGNKKDAIEAYKKAESSADTADYLNLGQINMRMGVLYQESFLENRVVIEKFQRSLNFYHKAGANKYKLICLSTIGKVYRVSNKDSAYSYINRAIELAQAIKDSVNIYENITQLAGAYYDNEVYEIAKDLSLSSINDGALFICSDECYHIASRAYAKLGMVDSAEYYYQFINNNYKPEAKIKKLITMIEIEKAKGDYKKVYEYNAKCYKIADSILNSSKLNELFRIEKRYDQQKIELEKSDLERNQAIILFILACVMLLLLVAWLIILKKRTQTKDNLILIEQLRRESRDSKDNLIHRLDSESKFKSALDHQFEVVKQLIEYSYLYESNTDKFMAKFKESVKLNNAPQTFWRDLKHYANETFNDAITVIESRHPNLTQDELNFICMYCCQFSNIEIMVCMGYTNEHSVGNKRLKIVKKIGIETSLDEYLKSFITTK